MICGSRIPRKCNGKERISRFNRGARDKKKKKSYVTRLVTHRPHDEGQAVGPGGLIDSVSPNSNLMIYALLMQENAENGVKNIGEPEREKELV